MVLPELPIASFFTRHRGLYYAAPERLWMTRHFVKLTLVLALIAVNPLTPAQESKPAPDTAGLAEVTLGDQLLALGKYDDAIAKYQSALKASSNLESAQAGLALALLHSGKSEAALQTVTAALNAHSDSARLICVLGRIKFRRGDMGEAENAFQTVLQIDPKNVNAYVGLARLYRSISMYAHSYAALKRAHDLDPANPEVQLMWLQTLPLKERLPVLQKYLAGPHSRSSSLEQYQEYLEKIKNDPPHSCKLVNAAESADIKMEYVHTLSEQWADGTLGPMLTSNFSHIEGVGLDVKLNNHSNLLLLDTGASGIMVYRKAANRAGLKRISDIRFGGIGDEGEQTGYLAIADHVKIGTLEFQDCVVTVSDKNVISENDAVGLIGADVFASFLLDVGIQQKRLRLSPLPRRPGEEKPVLALSSGDESDDLFPQQSDAAFDSNQTYHPRDRYIAPDMTNWTQVFRFDHMLLVPTRLNGSAPKLFLMDTGAFATMLSTRAAKEASKVESSAMRVKGASGEVSDVLRSENVDLAFSRFHQQNVNAVTFDLSRISQSAGTEISGLLGMNLLGMLDIRIDYRDGLVDFVYIDRHGVSH
jgi:tetratricopeptide (TPR) repeat protein